MRVVSAYLCPATEVMGPPTALPFTTPFVLTGTNATKAVIPSALAGSGAFFALTDAATVAWDTNSGFNELNRRRQTLLPFCRAAGTRRFQAGLELRHVGGHRSGVQRDGGAPMKPHDLIIGAAGGLILWFGWYGFNPGSTLSALDAQGIGRVSFNTTLAAC